MRDAPNAVSALVTGLDTAHGLMQASDVPTWHVIPSLQGENVLGDVLLRKGTSSNYREEVRSLLKTSR